MSGYSREQWFEVLSIIEFLLSYFMWNLYDIMINWNLIWNMINDSSFSIQSTNNTIDLEICFLLSDMF